MCVLISFTTFSETFFIPRKTYRDVNINAHMSSFKLTYFCRILTKLKFSRPIFEKSPNTKFHENPSSGTLFTLCGQKDRQPRQILEPFFAILPSRLKIYSSLDLHTRLFISFHPKLIFHSPCSPSVI